MVQQVARRAPRRSKYMAKDFFSYVIAITSPLAPAAQSTGNVVLDADSDFLWQKLTAYADVANDGQTTAAEVIPGITIVVTDTASGRALSNTGVPLAGFAGTGQLPFILPTPKIFKASGQITVSISNITDNITYSSLRLVFHGQKMFLGGG
jgi:hypothetical protein